MRAAAVCLAGAVALGCSGHLEFDPRVADGGVVSRTRDVGTGGARGAGEPPGTSGYYGEEAAGGVATADAGAKPAWGDAAKPGWRDGGTPGADAEAPAAWAAGTADASADAWAPAVKPADAAGAVAPGGAGTPGGEACPPGFNVLDTVFVKKCGGCHGASAPARGLDLVSPGLGARVVGVKSMCGGRPLLAPDGALGGHLLDKLEGSVAGCGAQMPSKGAPLTAVEMACVEEWAAQAIAKALTASSAANGR